MALPQPQELSEGLFNAILGSRQAVEVQMGETRLILFDKQTRFGYTLNLNSCSAIAIFSRTAAIISHIKPMSPSQKAEADRRGKTPGQVYSDIVMQRLGTLFNSNKRLFPKGSPVVLVSAFYRNQISNPDQHLIISTALQRLELTECVNVYYGVRQEIKDYQNAHPLAGSLLVTGPGGVRHVSHETHVWVEGVHVTSTDPMDRRSGVVDVRNRGNLPPPGPGGMPGSQTQYRSNPIFPR